MLNKILTGVCVSAACSLAFAGQQGGDHMDTPNRSQQGFHEMNPQPQNQTFDESLVKKAQQALNDRGYDVDVDGVMGTETSNALHDFQLEQGLRPTHDLTSETLAALNIQDQDSMMATGQSGSEEEATREPASVKYDAYYIFDAEQNPSSSREQALRNSPLKMYKKSVIMAGMGIPESALEPGTQSHGKSR